MAFVKIVNNVNNIQHLLLPAVPYIALYTALYIVPYPAPYPTWKTVLTKLFADRIHVNFNNPG